AGVLVIASRGAPASLASTAFNVGDAWVFGAVVSYAFYSALLRRRPAVHPLSFIAATFALGALMLVPFYAWETASGAPMRWSGTSALAVAYVALFPSLLAYLCFNRGVELIGANRAGQFVHLMPAFGTGLAIVFLGESVHGYHAVGIALIALGIGLAIARRAPPARAPE
ncbi:DMT family transporter, partial [Vineibacter terrae]|uniref:DMT family transporter n=1 Tax=Vineibacter terrae TaxID=2586908 RepID=UPI002E2F09B3